MQNMNPYPNVLFAESEVILCRLHLIIFGIINRNTNCQSIIFIRIFTVKFTDMIQAKNRKEITLDAQTLSILQIQAEKQGRKLKNYMEQVLKEQANSFELTDEYKAMMDVMLDKHEKGELQYTSWGEAKKELFKK